MNIKTFGPSIRDAYNGSFYSIPVQAGDSVEDTAIEYMAKLQSVDLPQPVMWIATTGAEINAFANTLGEVKNPLHSAQGYLLFPLDGMGMPIVPFKLNNGDRWFDDIVNNITENFI